MLTMDPLVRQSLGDVQSQAEPGTEAGYNNLMTNTPDVVILGGGVIGLTSACSGLCLR